MNENEIIDYYSSRANEYELIYQKPERQAELLELRSLLKENLTGYDILEIACGTGYWTQFMSHFANSIFAFDFSPDVLKIAIEKTYPHGNVKFGLGDSYKLSLLEGNFNACFAGFWYSHIPKQNQLSFIDQLHKRLGNDTKVIFIDNTYVKNNSTPISFSDDHGNTYQDRKLSNGNTYRILKNYPTPSELQNVLSDQAKNLKIQFLNYYWSVCYSIKIGKSLVKGRS